MIDEKKEQRVFVTQDDYDESFQITGLADGLSDLARAMERIASVMERLPNLLPLQENIPTQPTTPCGLDDLESL
jgi:hypothetical protein